MKIKITCDHCKKRSLIEETEKFCPKCKKLLKSSYKHKYSLKEKTQLKKNQRKKQLVELKFHHLFYTFVLGVALYIGIMVAQFNSVQFENEISFKEETSSDSKNKSFNITTFNSVSRVNDVSEYFGYISDESKKIQGFESSIKGQPSEKDLEKIRYIVFELSQKIEEVSKKKVPEGYENVQFYFQKKLYYKREYYQNYYDYIVSKDSGYIHKINSSIEEENRVWNLILDEFERELKKDGFNTYRGENGLNMSYKKTKYGF